MNPQDDASPVVLARRRARYLTGLLWHIGVFVIINAAFWALDLALGAPGAQWAGWITAIWGFALAFHVLAYLIDGRQLEDRKTRKYLDRDRSPSSGR
ncbi:hypothetical protein GIY30_05200 [Gordonia sp. HNM0687]|uniref:2TM domain-containing protein n=1 Tax=Gordonia mangrovi TaxID=2665643 RepID=A0A6L7GMN2_9ACTN|nr:2TM domain-containing protein [Gordonia mangrovi]MDY6808671.1 2TM domain-containing protein [Actinomycetota bacterium]MXP20753.1 hypothetical protein [Gordonia mangrovi]UVF78679.1 2TM domain-containing protein [Gordonia mangrovi]